MLTKATQSSANLNSLAKLISNAGFKRLMQNDEHRKYARQMKSLLSKNGAAIKDKCSIKDLIQFSYDYLLANYRHEYVYKSALLNTFILKDHSLSDTVLLNEFKIGNSKADTILVNGTNKVFEIKTELDSPARLKSQLDDYYKGFSEVYLLVHHSLVDRYMGVVDPHVGIMAFSPLNEIEVVYRATPDNSKLDYATMLRSLRKDEYLSVIKNLIGYVPTVQPIRLFNECLEIAKSFDAETVQAEFLKVIKYRINDETNLVTTKANLPDYIRLACYHANLTENDYLALTKRLNNQI
ncbi:sce7726 family protein [Pedobacter sp. SL55]|uniref:sce7726 family protein n=1 Tax=Pedobacter sp. SL55 TaxID=2995161 RepID=UPI002271210F|nr:sce7726 family protein [Pedobacter sp. SL55]WAC42238.1 sce7726 family protein [Pedobacter sp. SL55]